MYAHVGAGNPAMIPGPIEDPTTTTTTSPSAATANAAAAAAPATATTTTTTGPPLLGITRIN